MFVVLLSWVSKKVKYEMIRYVALRVDRLDFAKVQSETRVNQMN